MWTGGDREGGGLSCLTGAHCVLGLQVGRDRPLGPGQLPALNRSDLESQALQLMPSLFPLLNPSPALAVQTHRGPCTCRDGRPLAPASWRKPPVTSSAHRAPTGLHGGCGASARGDSWGWVPGHFCIFRSQLDPSWGDRDRRLGSSQVWNGTQQCPSGATSASQTEPP